MKYFNNIVEWNKINSKEQKNILSRPILKDSRIVKNTVKEIINNIKILGDQALKKYSILFDQYAIDYFQISHKKICAASLHLSKDLKNAILFAKNNITSFHKTQIVKNIEIETQIGVHCKQIFLPINSIGIYIPGGTAPLFSTVLMLAIPAKIAGCKNIFLCSPPPISYEVLYASYICGIDHIFQIGGAQAIAALAFGTETIPKVDKIFGPGNAYVTEAKLQVSSMFNGPAIDMLAGPSELLIIADHTANTDFIAADLLSQAEHGRYSQVILLTTCIIIAKKVVIAINQQLKKLSRFSEIIFSLKNSVIIVTDNISQCINISNTYAPEHLIIQTDSPKTVVNQIFNASSIFLGLWSPESAGDYVSGTNHVLPTYGRSVTDSALGISDFQKRILIQELTSKGLITLSKAIKVLSSAEKLEAHEKAVQIRLDYLKRKDL